VDRPVGTITLIHYYYFLRQEIDVDLLYDPPGHARIADVRWSAIIAFVAGAAAAWCFRVRRVGWLMGPGAKALGNVDLTWPRGLCGGRVRLPSHRASEHVAPSMPPATSPEPATARSGRVMQLVIRNGLLHDRGSSSDGLVDLLIDEGRFVAVEPAGTPVGDVSKRSTCGGRCSAHRMSSRTCTWTPA